MAPTAVEVMMQEHRLIERVLDALDVYARRLAEGEPPSRSDLADIVTFVREFADRKHHGKEEDVLFAAMLEAGFSREEGPIAVMLHEHDVGRALVGRMAAAASGNASWQEAERDDVTRAAGEFSQMLRAHIQKEDQILYPMAQRSLPAETMQRVDEDCRRVEAEYGERGDTARLEALAERLSATYTAA